jgi:hypothetical protein
MKLLLIFVGASFREGSQGSLLTDTELSFKTQRNAIWSHLDFINYLFKFNINIDIIINTYQTIYEDELKSWFNSHLIKILINDNLIGLENLVNDGLKSIENINDYDGVLVLRIDLFLKKQFFFEFEKSLNKNKILFPFICWERNCTVNGYPRVADTLMYLPKKYFHLIDKGVFLSHNAWYNNVSFNNLSNLDQDLIIYTLHDSDSEKDYNPLYYMVSRPESTVWHSKNTVVFSTLTDFKNCIELKNNIINESQNNKFIDVKDNTKDCIKKMPIFKSFEINSQKQTIKQPYVEIIECPIVYPIPKTFNIKNHIESPNSIFVKIVNRKSKKIR